MKLMQIFYTYRFFSSLKRKIYVTPTSYLQLLKTFQVLYGKRVEQITLQRNRYETGLEKLDYAASQVSDAYNH